MSTLPPFLRLTPGLLRTPALDPVTGQWSQPWAQYWMRQAEEIATMMQAAVIGDLSIFEVGDAAATSSLAQQLQEEIKRELIGAAPALSVTALLALERAAVLQDALHAQMGQLRTMLEEQRRVQGAHDALHARLAKLTAQVEALQRQEVLDA